MKKIILIIAAIAFMASNSNAQENNNDSSEKLHFGLKAGGNYSNVYDTKGDNFNTNTDPKFGLAIGAFVAIPIGKYLGFQPEILFSQKGFKASNSGTFLGIGDYKLTRTTNFIDVPLLIALKPSEFITILAGPQYSYLIKQRDEFTNSILSSVQEKEFQNDNLRKNILCFLGGVDINLTQFVISVRAGWDIQNNNGDGTSTNPRYKNMWYQATVGVRL